MNTLKMKSLFLLLDKLRSLSRQAPLQLAALLWYVAANEGCAMRQLIARIGIAPSTVSLDIARLGERLTVSGKFGLGLVRTEEDSTDRRSKRVFLTSKGKRFIQSLLATVAETAPAVPLEDGADF